jgi:hypothetical protein
MSSLFVPIIVGQLLTHDGPIIRFFGIPLFEIALEGRGKSWLGGVIKLFGILILLPSPKRLFPALAIGTSAKLEESINIKIRMPAIATGLIREVRLFLVELYNCDKYLYSCRHIRLLNNISIF